MLRVGISRQQYQRLESKGNPRLGTLELIAKGLNSELMLIPKEKLSAVQEVLERESSALNEKTLELSPQSMKKAQEQQKKSLSEDPCKDLLGDES